MQVVLQKVHFLAVNVLTGVDTVVCVQLMFQAERFGTVLTLVWLPHFVLLLTGMLLGRAGSGETTSSTGLFCAEKKENTAQNLHEQEMIE